MGFRLCSSPLSPTLISGIDPGIVGPDGISNDHETWNQFSIVWRIRHGYGISLDRGLWL